MENFNLAVIINHHWVTIGTYFLLIVISSIAFHYVFKNLLFKLIKSILSKQAPNTLKQLEVYNFFKLIAYLAPLVVTFIIFRYFPNENINDSAVQITLNIINIGLVITILLLLNALISLFLHQLSRRFMVGGQTVIRTLSQVFKIILAMIGLIIIFSIILNRSPVVILSSLGALTAILLLVFKDSILGFVASIQVTLLGNVKIGDWIEMPKFNADGTVIDISISSIRVQNFDKTITTIPTYSLVSEPVKNWRGMEESNTRRICRSVLVDVTSIEFINEEQLSQLRQVNILADYINNALPEIFDFNQIQKNNTQSINTRRLTNIGLFRNYVYNYLKNHPNINQSSTILVRQKQGAANGLPLEIYCFTNTTDWIAYEDIQSDIFDHIYSVSKSFNINIFQYANHQIHVNNSL